MKIKNIFNNQGPTLQQIIEKFLIDYCLHQGIFKEENGVVDDKH